MHSTLYNLSVDHCFSLSLFHCQVRKGIEMCVEPIGWFAVWSTCCLAAFDLKPGTACAKKIDFVQRFLSTPKVRILPQKRTPLLHRKSNVQPSVDVRPMEACCMTKNFKYPCATTTSEWSVCFPSDLQPRCQAMLKRHGCRAISVPLGAYGALSEWLFRTEGFKVTSEIAIEDQ